MKNNALAVCGVPIVGGFCLSRLSIQFMQNHASHQFSPHLTIKRSLGGQANFRVKIA
ncbi:hypothetical protein [uncultured Hyphomonas sp.]|uniref:hypothetical protein n=1 Tax=uncultured Hyphomonas sp. TaxID=225298 RepID=UPI002AABCD6F|nr:hypothetical protein [uncultured Hyphomonas sp.]